MDDLKDSMTIIGSGDLFAVIQGRPPLTGRESARLYSGETRELAPVARLGSILNHAHTNAPWDVVDVDQAPARLRELIDNAGPDLFSPDPAEAQAR